VRNSLRALAASELSEAARNAGRTEVLPVQWRKHLTLDVRAFIFPCRLPTPLHWLCWLISPRL
jgi:hypothetical protein